MYTVDGTPSTALLYPCVQGGEGRDEPQRGQAGRVCSNAESEPTVLAGAWVTARWGPHAHADLRIWQFVVQFFIFILGSS